MENELQKIQELADSLSLDRVKTEGLLFDNDYKRNDENEMCLVGQKAVITTHGKTTKVSFGNPGDKYKTYEEAVETTKDYWREYFKKRRQMDKSQTAKRGAVRRQKTYMAKKAAKNKEFISRQ